MQQNNHLKPGNESSMNKNKNVTKNQKQFFRAEASSRNLKILENQKKREA